MRVGAGRPKTGNTCTTVHLFLGKDEKARNLRAKLEEIKAEFNHNLGACGSYIRSLFLALTSRRKIRETNLPEIWGATLVVMTYLHPRISNITIFPFCGGVASLRKSTDAQKTV